MTRRATVEVCILVFDFDLCMSIRKLCTGVTCRYQVHIYTPKNELTFTFTLRLTAPAPPLLVNPAVLFGFTIPTFLGCLSPLSIPV